MSITILNPKRIERFRSHHLPTRTRRVYIVGASGAGKSTLWRALRTLSHSQEAFPTRLISRPTRPDDDPNENQYLKADMFVQHFQNRLIEFYWPKYLPAGVEFYGFRPCDASVAIYGCNNEFIINSDSLESHNDLHSDSIILLVTCSPEQRAKRLAARYDSHFVSQSELEYRLGTAANETKVRDASDLVFQNNTEEVSAMALQLLSLLSLDHEV